MQLYLKNELVALRALEPSDIDLLYEWENCEEYWTVSNTIAPFSRHVLSAYIQNSDRDIYETRQLRMIIDNLEGKSVGAIDLFDLDPFHLRAGLGILVHGEENRSRGYATAALQLMVRYCFGKLGLRQIYANILANNTISMKLFAGAGFEVAGVKKDWIREGDQWQDEYLLQLLKKKPF